MTRRKHSTATRQQQQERERLAARMAEPDAHTPARQAVADDDTLAARLAAAIASGMPPLDLESIPVHRQPEAVWKAVTAHEKARAGGPCSACGAVMARPAGTEFVRREDVIENDVRPMSLCSTCLGYAARYGDLTRYAVAVLRAVAGYGTAVPVHGLPPRAKLHCEAGGGNGQPWSHVNVDEAVQTCERYYGHSRRDLAAEQRTLIGITPHKWEAAAGPATPSQAHVFTDQELRERFKGKLGPDPAAARRAKDEAKRKRDKARRQREATERVQQMVARK